MAFNAMPDASSVLEIVGSGGTLRYPLDCLFRDGIYASNRTVANQGSGGIVSA